MPLSCAPALLAFPALLALLLPSTTAAQGEPGAGAPATQRGPSRRDWWAYQALQRPELPAVRDPAWVRTAVDRFILARLEQQGLRPAPPASRLTLVRRATYDLTGLPPTPAEVAAFMADARPGDVILNEHAVQRITIETLVEDLRAPRVDVRRAGAAIRRLAEDLAADMEHEEATLLHENLLRDDVVSLDSFGG